MTQPAQPDEGRPAASGKADAAQQGHAEHAAPAPDPGAATGRGGDGAGQPPRPDGSPPQNAAGMQGGGGMEGMDHGGMAGQMPGQGGEGGMAMSLTGRVSRPEVTAITVLTVVALVAGVLYSASRVNLTLAVRDVGGLVMPPGMVMNRETTAEAMRDMAAVDPRAVSFTAPTESRGDQALQPRLDNGVKVFDLDVSIIKWNILRDTQVMAYAFNRQVPGPRIRVTEGDRVRINVTNNLPDPTSVHWHGLILPNQFDGPAYVTQEPIAVGGRYSYEFTVQQVGTFFYHSHNEVDRQQALGLYGALIVDPRTAPAAPAWDKELVIQLQEWLFRDGYTFPAMPMEGALPNFFTINGKAYPETETVNLKVGERLLVRFVGSSSAFIHPMHIHGGPFRIVATDGNAVPEGGQWVKDTINVGPGERYDVIWEAREPGKWLLHCHINHHTTNDNREDEGGGGLMLILNVER